MTAEFHSLGLAQPSPQPSSGMTSRNTRASLTSIKYFQTRKIIMISTHLGCWSLGGNLSCSAGLQEGGHLILLDVLCKILRGLPILVLSLYIRLGVHQDLGDLPEAGGGSAVERSLAVPVCQVDIGSLLDESLDDVDLG